MTWTSDCDISFDVAKWTVDFVNGYHHPCNAPKSPDIKLLYRMRAFWELVKAGALVASQKFVDQSRNSVAISFTWKSKKNGNSCMFILWDRNSIKSTFCVRCRQKISGHGTQGTQRLWSRHHVRVRSKILPSQNRLPSPWRECTGDLLLNLGEEG